MGFFNKNPQDYFAPDTFTITKRIYEAPFAGFAPKVYQDEGRRLFAVKLPGAEPALFSYECILDAQISERSPEAESQKGSDRVLDILKNPQGAALRNAARRGYCLGLGVIVAVDTSDGIAKLELPIATNELKRGSRMYDRAMGSAKTLVEDFRSMMANDNNGIG